MMMEDISLLEEFERQPEHRSKYFDLFAVLSFLYILFEVVDTTFYIERMTLRSRGPDWMLMGVLLTLPATGLVFLLRRKKIGWIVSLFYYVVFATIGITAFLKELNKYGLDEFSSISRWRGYVLLTIWLTCFSLLVTKSIRQYLKVTKRMFMITLIVSVTGGIAFSIFAFIASPD